MDLLIRKTHPIRPPVSILTHYGFLINKFKFQRVKVPSGGKI